MLSILPITVLKGSVLYPVSLGKACDARRSLITASVVASFSKTNSHVNQFIGILSYLYLRPIGKTNEKNQNI